MERDCANSERGVLIGLIFSPEEMERLHGGRSFHNS